MIQSMTGFGKSVISLTDKHISIEIKSLNSKSIDINTRIPLLYREKELDFRKLIAERLNRFQYLCRKYRNPNPFQD